MAQRKVYIGSVGPYLFDDTDTISTEDDDFGGMTFRGVLSDAPFVVASLELLDTDISNVLAISWNENDSADRALTLLVRGGDRTVDLYENLKVDNGYDVILQALGQANSLILNESLTIGDGNDGTITFSAASKTVTVAGSCTLNDWFDQAVKAASTPSFAGLTLTGTLDANDQYIVRVQQLRGCDAHHLNIYANALSTAATEKDIIFWTLDEANNIWIEVFRCLHNGATPTLKMNKVLDMNSQNITGLGTIATASGTLTIDETASISGYHTDARGDTRYLYRENAGAFTPDGDYEPATKKYVDDNIGVSAHAVLDGSVHTDSVADAVTRGSIIYGNATPKWDELVKGAANTFLGSDGTDVSYRTAAQTMASLSGAAGASFAWNAQNLTGVGAIGCGTITIADGSSLALQEDITFSGATTVNQIKFPDALAVALAFREDVNLYQTFVTTNGSEAVVFHKNVGVKIGAPTNELHVHGGADTRIHITNTTTGALVGDGVYIRLQDGTALYMGMQEASSNFYFFVDNDAGHGLSITTGGNVDIPAHDGATVGLKLGGTLVTASAVEVNILDGVSGVTAAELSYIGDVTGLIQNQIDAKAPLASPNFTGTPLAPDHGAAAVDMLVNVCYGTGAAPDPATVTEGALFIKYVA